MLLVLSPAEEYLRLSENHWRDPDDTSDLSDNENITASVWMNNVLIYAACMYKGSEMDLGFA